MPLIATLTCVDTGHDDYPPRPIIQAQAGYTIRGLDIATVGSLFDTHCNTIPVCHDAVVASGSAKYFIRGQPIARIGDAVSCGGTIATGQEGYDLYV